MTVPMIAQTHPATQLPTSHL